VGKRGHEATLDNALSGAINFGIRQEEAESLLEEIRQHVEARWRPILAESGIGDQDIQRLSNSFIEAGRRDWLKAGSSPG
jgi:hypothetical protein